MKPSESQNHPSQTTLKELAAAAGVAPSTVARALKNHPRISKETRETIKALAEKMGYQRDSELSNLMQRVRKGKKQAERPTIALLVWQTFPVNLILQHEDSMVAAIYRRTLECGYQPEFFNLADFENNRSRLVGILRARGIRGAILCPVERPAPLPQVPWDELCVVATSYSLFSHHLHRCVPNLYDGMMECIDMLKGLGYRRIGAVFAPSVNLRTHGYFNAAYHVAERNCEHGQLAPLLITDATGEATFKDWLNRWQPEVIITGSSRHWVTRWLEKMNLRIPEEIGLADLQVPDNENISGIWQNHPEIGARSVDFLISLLAENEIGLPRIPRVLSIQCEWREGTTTRRVQG